MISIRNLIGNKNLIRIAMFLILAAYGCNRDSRPIEGKGLVYNINLSSITSIANMPLLFKTKKLI